jgi:hypothetical protein
MPVGYWWEGKERKRPLGIPSRSWVDNIKVDLGELDGD